MFFTTIRSLFTNFGLGDDYQHGDSARCRWFFGLPHKLLMKMVHIEIRLPTATTTIVYRRGLNIGHVYDSAMYIV